MHHDGNYPRIYLTELIHVKYLKSHLTGFTYVHRARKPWRVIHPWAFVTTALLISAPHGIIGHALNKFVISVGDK